MRRHDVEVGNHWQRRTVSDQCIRHNERLEVILRAHARVHSLWHVTIYDGTKVCLKARLAIPRLLMILIGRLSI
jgi:hypothetical protein